MARLLPQEMQIHPPAGDRFTAEPRPAFEQRGPPLRHAAPRRDLHDATQPADNSLDGLPRRAKAPSDPLICDPKTHIDEHGEFQVASSRKGEPFNSLVTFTKSAPTKMPGQTRWPSIKTRRVGGCPSRLHGRLQAPPAVVTTVSVGSFVGPTARASADQYTSVPPCRIIDTRVMGAGGALVPAVQRNFLVSGTTGFAAQGATPGVRDSRGGYSGDA